MSLHQDPCRKVRRQSQEPALGVLLEGDAGGSGVDVLPPQHVGLDLRQPLLGAALLPVREGLALLRAIGADVAGAVAHPRAVTRGLDLD